MSKYLIALLLLPLFSCSDHRMKLVSCFTPEGMVSFRVEDFKLLQGGAVRFESGKDSIITALGACRIILTPAKETDSDE